MPESPILKTQSVVKFQKDQRVRRHRWSAALLSALLLISAGQTVANPDIDPSVTTAAMEEILAGPGVTIEPGSMTVPLGQSYQYGAVSNGHIPDGPGPVLGIDRGVFMVTGQTSSISGPNNAANMTTTSSIVASDPQLTTVDPRATYDPVVIQLRLVPDKTYLKFLFVFGSDEYPEYVCSIYNDAFGFFIKPTNSSTWQNAALIPGTSQPIAVNTINNGSCGASGTGVASDLTNSALYVDNGTGSTPANNANLQYDGFTVPMIVDVPVTPGQAYDVKLAVADVGDASYDSAVFMKWIMSSDFLANADVELNLTADDTSPAIGNNVTFTLSVTNNGPDTVPGLQSTFNLPTGFTLVSDTSGGNYNSDIGVWTLPVALTNGATQSIEITATAGGAAQTINAFAEVTSMSAADEDSLAGNGPQTPAEDDESTLTLNVSDAPDRSDAPTTGTSYGEASHLLPGNLLLGNLVNGDITSPANADASGDTSDDGVTFTPLSQGSDAIIPVHVTGSGGYLQAWIDWDGNGTFTDTLDQVATNVQDGGAGDTDGIADGIISLQVNVPSTTTDNPTFARFRWSSDLSIGPLGVATDGEVEDYQVTFGGTRLAGTLIIDNGLAGGTAHDGLINGAETTGSVGSVQILAIPDGTVLSQASVDLAGNWTATLPPGFSGNIQLVASAASPYLLISESAGTLNSPTNVNAYDGVIEAPVSAGQSYSGINFGVIEPPALSMNQSANVEPGNSVVLTHQYLSHTTGTVDFTLVDQISSPAGEFNATLSVDALCDGTPDGSALSVPVTAGDRVCLLVQVHATSSIVSGSRYTFGLTASTNFDSTSQTYELRNDDLITYSSERLELTKRVRNITDGTSEGVLNTASSGDTLEYIIILHNASAGPTTEITINDTTPPWTELSEPIQSPTTVAGGVNCVVTTPNNTGYEGPIQWECDGAFPSGEEASLSFRVNVQ